MLEAHTMPGTHYAWHTLCLARIVHPLFHAWRLLMAATAARCGAWTYATWPENIWTCDVRVISR